MARHCGAELPYVGQEALAALHNAAEAKALAQWESIGNVGAQAAMDQVRVALHMALEERCDTLRAADHAQLLRIVKSASAEASEAARESYYEAMKAACAEYVTEQELADHHQAATDVAREAFDGKSAEVHSDGAALLEQSWEAVREVAQMVELERWAERNEEKRDQLMVRRVGVSTRTRGRGSIASLASTRALRAHPQPPPPIVSCARGGVRRVLLTARACWCPPPSACVQVAAKAQVIDAALDAFRAHMDEHCAHHVGEQTLRFRHAEASKVAKFNFDNAARKVHEDVRSSVQGEWGKVGEAALKEQLEHYLEHDELKRKLGLVKKVMLFFLLPLLIAIVMARLFPDGWWVTGEMRGASELAAGLEPELDVAVDAA